MGAVYRLGPTPATHVMATRCPGAPRILGYERLTGKAFCPEAAKEELLGIWCSWAHSVRSSRQIHTRQTILPKHAMKVVASRHCSLQVGGGPRLLVSMCNIHIVSIELPSETNSCHIISCCVWNLPIMHVLLVLITDFPCFYSPWSKNFESPLNEDKVQKRKTARKLRFVYIHIII